MGANGIERGWAAAFTINNYGYICMGQDTNSNYLNSLWQYYPCSDTNIVSAMDQIQSSGQSCNLYPNPNNGRYTFSYYGMSGQYRELRISNVLGKLVNTYQLKDVEGSLVIDENNLGNGVYFYQVINEGEIIYQSKFIIAK